MPATVTDTNTGVFEVTTNLISSSGSLPFLTAGDTVVGISTDDETFTVVPTDGTTATVDGTYLSYAVNASGAVTTGFDQSNQSIIDSVNANASASTPLSDILYYEVTDGSGNNSVYEVINDLGDLAFQTPNAPPYSSTETVAAGTMTEISGVTVTKALSTGQTDNSGDTLTVSANVFDFTNQASDGQLSIDPTVAGGGGSVTYSADGGTVTIDGTIGQINADLSTLTYTAVNSGTDSIIIYATDSPDPATNRVIGNITVGSPTAMPVANTNTTIFEVQPGIGSGQGLPDIVTGDTVTGISTDDVNFTIVPTDGTQATVNGAYLTFAVDDLGNASIGQAQDSQTLIDDINANDGSSTPLTDSLYYEVQDSSGTTTVDQYTFDLGDTGFTAPTTQPYSSPSTLQKGDTLAIGGAMVTKELSTDGTYGGVAASAYTLSVSIGVFDFTRQAADGTVSIDPTVAGGGGTVTYGTNDGSVTIVGTIGEINADLSTLTYTAVQTGTDYIDISDIDGPTPSANQIIGSIDVVCFCAGTMIQTTQGEVTVEGLAVGDLVMTTSGTPRPIRWIGHRTLDGHTHPRPEEAHPIRIAQHAFGENKPTRDLYVSPAHAICVDMQGEVLIPASALANGSTITQIEADQITYWHIELDSHDILIANGLPAESYIHMGNRRFFLENDVVAFGASPDVGLGPLLRTPADYCRPFITGGPILDAVRADLQLNAETLGWALAHSPMAGLHLTVGGTRIDPIVRGLTARFAVPKGAGDAWLVSTTSRPSDVIGGEDERHLGVSLAELTIDDGFDERSVIALGHPLLSTGFHRLEEGWRWTAGRAHLPAVLWDHYRDGFFLRVQLTSPALPRWVMTPPLAAASSGQVQTPVLKRA